MILNVVKPGLVLFDERLPVRDVSEQGGQQGKCQDDGTQQRERQCQRDRGKDLSFDPLEGEDGYEGHDNDGFGKEHRT